MSEYRVPVYESHEDKSFGESPIARVRYNTELDFWDGRNFSNGGTGFHKGITKLKDGRFVIIEGSQWQGDRDYAYVVSDDEALNEILKSNHADLLKRKKFVALKELYKQKMIEEDEDDSLIEEAQ
ncbi:hypothetical protein AAXE64_28055 [Priestia megaterium]|uniref:hypothetical protein n=1 Tax=Priestia megaterium TaxID=1404 RepID=UPI003CFFA83D